MTRPLPDRPHLEHLKKQAKEWLHALRERRPEALERYRAVLSEPAPAAPRLADAQHALAREYGFSSWMKLRAHVEAKAIERDPVAAFVAAIKAGDTAGARTALERHPELRSRLDDPLPGFDFGATALIAALPSGERELIDLLLDSGADVNRKSHWWAGGFGVLDSDHPLLQHLIDRGARVDAYAAARHGWMERLIALVSADPELVHARGGDGQTPLHVAANVEVAGFLLDHGAEIDARCIDHESTAAQYAVRDRPEVARLLVRRGCATDLLMCSALGDPERVRRELDADPARIRMSVSTEWFPKRNFHSGGTIYIWTLGALKGAHVIAREFGHEDVFALLIERSPAELRLALAGELGDEALFRELLASRPGLTKTLTDDDRRKLVNAAQSDNLRAVRLMLEAGWPLDVGGQHGGTALHWASWHGNAEMVRELLRHHAPLERRDTDHHQTPLGWALHGSLHSWFRERGDHVAVLEALVAAGATLPPPDAEPEASPAVIAWWRRQPRH